MHRKLKNIIRGKAEDLTPWLKPKPVALVNIGKNEDLRVRMIPGENIRQKAVRLIAEADRVPEYLVTPAYIEEQRCRKIYPHVRFRSPALPGHRSFTGNEFLEIERLIDELMAAI
jgi:hypothetical protein